MTHQAKQNVQTATNILTLIGIIAGGVFYFTNVMTTNATQDLRINSLERTQEELSIDQKQQGKDVAIIKYYFDNGVLKRLQLEDLKRAAAEELISKQ